ncbi:hypothetical protein GCM10009415_28490 [Chitinophaga japonensis]
MVGIHDLDALGNEDEHDGKNDGANRPPSAVRLRGLDYGVDAAEETKNGQYKSEVAGHRPDYFFHNGDILI